MARPKKATVDYFPHDTEQGATTFILQNRWGNDGFAAWYKILERLGATNGHYLDCRHKGTWHHLQAYTMVNEIVLTEILDTLADLEAIDKVLWSFRIVYSQKFVDGIRDAYRRREDSLPTRGKIFAITNVQDKEFLTAETLPKEVYPVRSTEREREREREREEHLPETEKMTRKEFVNLYQQSLGTFMPPILNSEQERCCRDYTPEVIRQAFQIAGENRARSFDYVRKVIEGGKREDAGVKKEAKQTFDQMKQENIKATIDGWEPGRSKEC